MLNAGDRRGVELNSSTSCATRTATAQGLHCNKPLTADDFTELLADWKRLSLGKCRLEACAGRLAAPGRRRPQAD